MRGAKGPCVLLDDLVDEHDEKKDEEEGKSSRSEPQLQVFVEPLVRRPRRRSSSVVWASLRHERAMWTSFPARHAPLIVLAVRPSTNNGIERL